jgi:hypothetical protein
MNRVEPSLSSNKEVFMKYFGWIVCIVVFVVLVSPANALILRRAESVEVGVDEVIDDDLIVFASNVDIKGVVTGNVCAFGQTVNVTGDIGGSLFIGAANSSINARSVQTVWAAGGNLNVSGNVTKNVILAGGSLKIESNAIVGKDLLAYGGNFAVDGNINGAIKGAVGKFVMAGKSSRVKIRADKARIKSTAVVSGDFHLTSEDEPEIDEGAIIGGELSVREIEKEEAKPFFFAVAPLLAFLFGVIKVIVWISKIIVGIMLIALCQKYVRRVMDTFVKQTWKSLGVGFLGIIAIPVASVVLFATLIGYPLGVLSLYIFSILWYVSSIFIAVILGEKVIQIFNKGKEVSLYLSFVIGMLILLIVGFIPILGFLVRIFVILFGFGTIILATWHLVKDIREKELA